MAFFLGLILGDLLGRVGFFRAAGALLLLASLSFVSYRLLAANGAQGVARAAAFAVPAMTFLWAMWSPASARSRLYIVEGVYLAARLLTWLCGFMACVVLLQVGFRLGSWMSREGWGWCLIGGALWTLQAAISAWTMRSDRLLGDRSVL